MTRDIIIREAFLGCAGYVDAPIFIAAELLLLPIFGVLGWFWAEILPREPFVYRCLRVVVW
jgi:hypothetical protein